MKVWIDQDLCTGDGLCEEILPDIFTLQKDGIAYVKDATGVYDDHDSDHSSGHRGLVTIPDDMLAIADEAREECPGECIFIEPA